MLVRIALSIALTIALRGRAAESDDSACPAAHGTCRNPTRVPDAAASAAVKKTWLQTNVPAECETAAGVPASTIRRAISLTGSVAKCAAGAPATLRISTG